MMAFIQEHREQFGVEPMCKVLPIAPSTVRHHLAIVRDPSLACARRQQDTIDLAENPY